MTKQVRDWQEDMKLLRKLHKNVADVANILDFVAPYWMSQAAELKCNRDLAMSAFKEEKARSEAAEDREKKLREAIEAVINERSQWNDAGNALDVMERYLCEVLASLYPEEETK